MWRSPATPFVGYRPSGTTDRCWVSAELDDRMRLNETDGRGEEAIMDVYEAVTSRRAVRGFKDEPVSREVLERVLSAAAWSPSGSNIQPWNTYVLTGSPLAELKTRAVERVAHGDPWDERQYEMYPSVLKSPYRRTPIRLRQGALQRARHCPRGLGGATAGGHRQLELFRCSRRPVLLHRPRPGPAPMGRRRHVSADRHAAAPRRRAAQLPADGVVASRETVAEVLSPPDGLVLFCGMSIGYEDTTVRYARTSRASLDETVTFVGR